MVENLTPLKGILSYQKVFEAGACVFVKIASFGTHRDCESGFPVPLWLCEGHLWL